VETAPQAFLERLQNPLFQPTNSHSYLGVLLVFPMFRLDQFPKWLRLVLVVNWSIPRMISHWWVVMS